MWLCLAVISLSTPVSSPINQTKYCIISTAGPGEDFNKSVYQSWISQKNWHFVSDHPKMADSPNINFQKDQKTLTTVIKMD